MAYESRQAWIDQVRQQVDIVEVVGRYVALQRKGRHWWGLCPFHAEKTPSFSVDPDQQLFYCFGCHQGGTVFTFVMKMEGLGFREAAERLAEEIGVPTPAARSEVLESDQRLRAVMEWSLEFFLKNFQRHRGKLDEYLRQRGVAAEMVDRFLMGYAPDGWRELLEALSRRGVRLEEMIRAGVVVARENGQAYDRWRGRLMFPIWDAEGRVVGFGGRALKEGQEPKYLNSPETPLFHKSRLLYASHLARPLWRQGHAALVVEGYFDVVACHQAGLAQAVAPLGTALGEAHARWLRRFTDEVDLLLDQDGAGQEAMRRAFFILSSAGLKVNAVQLPDGMKDPSDVVQRLGEAALVEWVARKVPFVEAQILKLAQNAGHLNPRARAEAAERIKPLIQAVQDPIERSGYLDLLAKTLSVHQEILTQSFGDWQGVQHTIGKNRHNMGVMVPQRRGVPSLDVRILAALKNHPGYVKRVRAVIPEWAEREQIAHLLRLIEEGQLEASGSSDEAWSDPEAASLYAAVMEWTEPDGGGAAIDDLVELWKQKHTLERYKWLQERVRQGETTAELLEEIRRLGPRMGQYLYRKEG
ncbi:MAG: DNA primase [Firmicutes bacterium]|nr:DNA primase [Bacillota bacterium]